MWHTLGLIVLVLIGLFALTYLPIFVCYWIKDINDNVKGRGVYGQDD
jgi:NhaP-type Na+/H+ or K+/H+ antiporter